MSKIHSAIIVEKSMLDIAISKLEEHGFSVVEHRLSEVEEIKNTPQLAMMAEYHRRNQIYHTVVFVRNVDADELIENLLYVID